MAKLIVDNEVIRKVRKLPDSVGKLFERFVEEFPKDPHRGSFHLHPLDGYMEDSKVRGAYLNDAWRIIIVVPETGDSYVAVYLDHHDSAYRWARNKRFGTNEMTGRFEVFTMDERVKEIEKEPETVGLFDLHNDKDLLRGGIPKPLLPAVRAVENEDDLLELMPCLPEDAQIVLSELHDGASLQDALNRAELSKAEVASTPVESGNFEGIQERSRSLKLIRTKDELDQMLDLSIEEWRLFLHPAQRQLVNWNLNGPMCVTGAAGTGKTVVLMHRAARLARECDSGQRVLITTYTKNLATTIENQINQLADDVASRIKVTNLDSLARHVYAREGLRLAPADKKQIANAVRLAVGSSALPLDEKELAEEFLEIAEGHGLDCESDYLTAIRAGRPRLGRKQRRTVWPVLQRVRKMLADDGFITFPGVIHAARKIVERDASLQYDHVLVDETQDFGLEALRLLSALAKDGKNPICLVGDGHQRIYGRRIPLSRAGLQVRGRSRRLRVNYRTSEEIRMFAQGLLSNAEIDDLDAGRTNTFGDRSLYSGPEPEILNCADSDAEALAVRTWVERLTAEHGLKPHEICVVPERSKVTYELEGAGFGTYKLDAKVDPGSACSGVRTGTMHRIKGLEYRAVALLCSRKSDAINNLGAASLEERCLRYVAATRAREHLLVTVAEN